MRGGEVVEDDDEEDEDEDKDEDEDEDGEDDEDEDEDEAEDEGEDADIMSYGSNPGRVVRGVSGSSRGCPRGCPGLAVLPAHAHAFIIYIIRIIVQPVKPSWKGRLSPPSLLVRSSSL
eukprot:4708026-Pyramimonas_sp.AAC.1